MRMRAAELIDDLAFLMAMNGCKRIVLRQDDDGTIHREVSMGRFNPHDPKDVRDFYEAEVEVTTPR